MANKPLNTELLDRAIIFAVQAHAGTERRGKGFPYIVHPMEAMAIVSTMTADQELLAAAALHDTVEDTDVTVEDLRKEFGDRIAALVADDGERDYGNAEKVQPLREKWEASGYQVISMKDDFRTIYGDDVIKTGAFHWLEDLAEDRTPAGD